MARAYTFNSLIAALVVTLGMALINALADPYGIWNTPLISGINTKKNAGFHDRIRKYVGWSRWEQPPQTILLGTSRTADGLHADHPALGNAATYNMALSGQPIHESLVLFRHSLKGGKLKRAVIGLDFFAFNAYWALGVVDEKRLESGPNLDLLLNLDTLGDSLATIRQSLSAVEVMRPAHAGDMSDSNIAAASGLPAQTTFVEVEKIFVTYHRPAPYRLYSHRNPRTRQNTLDDFRELLRMAHANNIDLHLFISPSHAWHWEGVANVGLWDDWEQWKRSLASINMEEAERAGEKPWPLWDFSGYNSITTEAVPAAGNTAQMKWYSDSSHYNKACGDLILDRMFGLPSPLTEAHHDFGILIDDRNIDTHLSGIRNGRAQYAESHRADIRKLADIPKQVWSH